MHDRIKSYTNDKYGKRDFHNFLLLFLEKFDEHCRQYQINYSLAYGSALGCVRNHGFIPWDDDVDVIMKRVDYNRFLDTLKGDSLFAKECQIQMPTVLLKVYDSTCKEFPVHIDIYAVDNVPDGSVWRFLKLLKVKMLNQVIIGRMGMAHKGKKNSLSCKIRKICANIISFPISVERLRNLFTTICIKDNFSLTQRIGCYSAGRFSIGKYHQSTMMDRTIYMKFEDIEMSIVADYHSYLVKEYGLDYMIPKTKKGETIND